MCGGTIWIVAACLVWVAWCANIRAVAVGFICGSRCSNRKLLPSWKWHVGVRGSSLIYRWLCCKHGNESTSSPMSQRGANTFQQFMGVVCLLFSVCGPLSRVGGGGYLCSGLFCQFPASRFAPADITASLNANEQVTVATGRLCRTRQVASVCVSCGACRAGNFICIPVFLPLSFWKRNLFLSEWHKQLGGSLNTAHLTVNVYIYDWDAITSSPHFQIKLLPALVFLPPAPPWPLVCFRPSTKLFAGVVAGHFIPIKSFSRSIFFCRFRWFRCAKDILWCCFASKL